MPFALHQGFFKFSEYENFGMISFNQIFCSYFEEKSVRAEQSKS